MRGIIVQRRTVHVGIFQRNISISAQVITIAAVFLFPVGQIIRLLLPEKYFLDSASILKIVNGDTIAYQNRDFTFQRTVDFYRILNIFGFTSLQEWSLFLGFVGTLLLIPLLLSLPNLTLFRSCLLIGFVALLNIYVFCLSKDFIQFLIFYLIFTCIRKGKTVALPAVLSASVLLCEALFYRRYYVLIAVFFVGYITVFKRAAQYCQRHGVKFEAGAILLMMCLLVLLLLGVASVVAPSQYSSLILVREKTNLYRVNDDNAQSVILNVLPGTDIISAFLNVSISAMRMMFPVEMLNRGSIYIFFAVFQFLFAIIYVYCMNKISMSNTSMYLAFCLISAYLMVSFFFEPDFGSWVRHESCLVPILCVMLGDSSSRNSEEYELPV